MDPRASTTDIAIATERHLVHHQREGRNRIDGTIAANATSMVLEFASPLASRGQMVAVDFEVFEVWDRTNQTVTVEGGQEGSTPAQHLDGAHVIIGPKLPRNTILKELNNVLTDLSSPATGLFKVTPLDITFSAGVLGYDLAADFLEVYDTPGPRRAGGARRRGETCPPPPRPRARPRGPRAAHRAPGPAHLPVRPGAMRPLTPAHGTCPDAGRPRGHARLFAGTRRGRPFRGALGRTSWC